ncbi:unnamed protein product [Acanthoscelides obtectus]|uniref:Uncharacterized protein n=1 Tax=Acanthoscelides obtectus TaxID=200917 RepID=A0A9P0QGQ0_ACAOB|nr:unnamed protein product [Acanthoscelides obtectus]CAK1682410.1 hypothetical protein AOBTE_LOCUS33611 [Acanthoscelides obtectus]
MSKKQLPLLMRLSDCIVGSWSRL